MCFAVVGPACGDKEDTTSDDTGTTDAGGTDGGGTDGGGTDGGGTDGGGTDGGGGGAVSGFRATGSYHGEPFTMECDFAGAAEADQYEATTFYDSASAKLFNLYCTSRGKQGERILMAFRVAWGGSDTPGPLEATYTSCGEYNTAASQWPQLTFEFGLEPAQTGPCTVGDEITSVTLSLDAVDLAAGTASGSMSGTFSSSAGTTDFEGEFDIQG
ncbi:hypothetical protein L6R53_27120 [Myxococcota bacterium]|nr:hypothetical protein [Myxococcota bacterium]